MTPEDFRRHGHELVDWIADYRERAARGAFPVRARVAPGALRRALPAGPPADAEPFAAILADLERLILPACTHWLDPRFFAYFPSNGLPAAVLGDFVSTGLGQLGLNWESSPALTELEERTTDWLRQMFGLDAGWSGVIHDTASTATLVALICARERSSNHGATGAGLQSTGASPLVVYATAQSHSSVRKAALLAGFGDDNLRMVPVDAAFALRADALETLVAADRAAGRIPSAVVATIGTTATTAIDPVESIAAIAAREGLWLHVDAALAGSAMILPECRTLWQGIDAADSLVINPHKWLGASFDCSVYFVRDAQHLVRVMGSSPSYLRTGADHEVRNLRDWGIPLGRRFRALKLWFLIREQGVAGLQARLRRDLEFARWLAARVDATPNWRRLAPVPLQTVVLRHEPDGLAAEFLDRHNRDWAERLNASGEAYLTPALIDGRWAVRVSFGGAGTQWAGVEALWAAMQRAAAAAG